MISAQYCCVMARYNRWQNSALISAADRLDPAARWQERGAFFGSIAATLSHLYWADALMLERMAGKERPHETVTHSLSQPSDWHVFKTLRIRRDAQIEAWAQGLCDADLAGVVTWFAPKVAERISMSRALCAVQFFNHQTHHRGQIHAMLTAAGVQTAPTDIPANLDEGLRGTE